VTRAKLGPAFGHIDSAALLEIERRLAVFLGIAK
jgi:mRNA interferase MazF